MKLCITILMLSVAISAFSQSTNLDSPKIYAQKDTLSQNLKGKLDSIQTSFYQRSDSLKATYQSCFAKLDSAKSNLQAKLNSVISLHAPTKKYMHAMDSVNELHDKTTEDMNKKLQSIKDQTTKKLQALKLPRQLDEKVSTVTNKIEGFKMPSDLNIPSLDLPENSLGKLNDLNFNPSVPELDNPLDKVNVNTPDLGPVSEVKNMAGDASEISSVSSQASSYSKGVQQIASGDSSTVNTLLQTAEDKAAEMSGVKDIEQQTQGLEQYKSMAEQAKDPIAFKEQSVQKVYPAVINHFAGKEQQLQEAIETVSKYKKNYSSVTDISKLPKKRPNEMKNKPLIERLVPGIGLQVKKEGGDVLVDFNPYVGYRFTGKITGGLGWNQRVAYNTKHNYFNPAARIYGPRVFGEYDLWKGFFPRVEVEIMNAFVPPFTMPATVDRGNRQWVLGVFVGLKKDYRFLRSVRGTASIMTRLFDPQHKSPYAEVVNVRFGFEFPMKKKKVERAD